MQTLQDPYVINIYIIPDLIEIRIKGSTVMNEIMDLICHFIADLIARSLFILCSFNRFLRISLRICTLNSKTSTDRYMLRIGLEGYGPNAGN